MERVYMVEGPDGLMEPPQPLPNHFKTLDGFAGKFLKNVGRHTPVTRNEFLLNYSGRKLTIYTKAVESLEMAPITRRDARLKTFVKAEKLNLTRKPDPAPRVIQPRAPRYNVELGVYLRKFEHTAFKAIEKVFGEPTVFKGYDLGQQGKLMRNKWDKYQHPVAIGLDASRFDQHVSVDALKWEHSLYNVVFNHCPKLKRLLKWQLKNEGIAFASDGMIRYKKDGCRMSGDMNTSLGNCILMCAMIYTMAQEIGVKLSLANNGDDCVVICEESDESLVLAAVPQFFRNFGFTMTIEKPVYIFEHVEFCQTQPVFDGTEYLMVRKPSIAMSKDLTSVLPLRTVQHFKEWASAVSMCGLAITGGIPVWQAFYSCLNSGVVRTKLTSTGLFAENGLAYHARHMHRAACKPTPEARLSFWEAFGITPDTQVALEEYYANFIPSFDEPLPRDIHHISSHELLPPV